MKQFATLVSVVSLLSAASVVTAGSQTTTINQYGDNDQAKASPHNENHQSASVPVVPVKRDVGHLFRRFPAKGGAAAGGAGGAGAGAGAGAGEGGAGATAGKGGKGGKAGKGGKNKRMLRFLCFCTQNVSDSQADTFSQPSRSRRSSA